MFLCTKDIDIHHQVNTQISYVFFELNHSLWTERNDAENAAWNAPGIITVDNRIMVDTEGLAI